MRALLIASACCAAFVPSIVLADEFSEFRIPKHRWHTLSMFFGGGANSSKGHSAGHSETSSDLSATLRIGDEWGLDSDDLSAWINSNLSSGVDSRHDTFNDERLLPDYFSRLNTEITTRSGSEVWHLALGLRHYPWSVPVGFELEGEGQGEYFQAHQDSRRTGTTESGASRARDEDRRFSLRWTYLYTAYAAASAGLGRVRDATGVYSAFVLERRLLETGALSRPLSRQARERIAALYTIAPDYSIVHDRPERYFWRDLEEILIEDGALGDAGLDAYSLRRADEIYAPGSVLRRTGYFVGPTLSAEHYQSIQRYADDVTFRHFLADTLASSYSSSRAARFEFNDDLLMIGARAELHRPAGYRWQLDLDGRALVPARDFHAGARVSSNASLTYLIADRWLADAFTFQSRSYFIGSLGFGTTAESRWLVVYGAAVRYYLEDRATLSLGMQERQSATDHVSPGSEPMHSYSRDAQIALTLSYACSAGSTLPA